MSKRLIGAKVCKVVKTNGEGVILLIGNQVSVSSIDGPQQASGIVVPRHLLPEQMDHAGLGPVRKHLDGVDEVLRLGAEAFESLLLG